MVQPSAQPQFASAKTETEVAVLQVQFQNLNDKVDDIKTDLKDLSDQMDANNTETTKMLKEFQAENIKSHKEMATKITSLEKWRWMIMGAGIALGAVGFEVLGKIFGI